MRIQFCGHSAILIEIAGKVVGLDPWLEGNPLTPVKLKNPDKLDLIVLSHGHSDHASDAVRLALQYGIPIAATWELLMILIGEGLPEDKIIPMNKGGTIRWEGLSVSLTHAFHSSSYDTKSRGTLYAGEPCGIVISDHSNRDSIYHAGDTALFSDMTLIKDQYNPRVALIPCGDRFTMGPIEAAKCAVLIGAKINIPIHHSTFPLLSGKPEQFVDECCKLDVAAKIMGVGEEYLSTDS